MRSIRKMLQLEITKKAKVAKKCDFSSNTGDSRDRDAKCLYCGSFYSVFSEFYLSLRLAHNEDEEVFSL